MDAEGPVEARADATHLIKEDITAALPPFLELTQQLPPQYSAIKKGGVKGYEAARKGESLELPPRPAGYRDVRLLEFAPTRDTLPTSFSLTQDGTWAPNPNGVAFDLPPTLGDFPTALFYLQVQAGTYVRAFARDLGNALGVPAHLSGLVRTRAGTAGLEDAVNLEDVPNAEGRSLAAALPYPLVELSDGEVARVRQGQRLSPTFSGRAGLTDAQGELVAVAEVLEERMKLLRVWQ